MSRPALFLAAAGAIALAAPFPGTSAEATAKSSRSAVRGLAFAEMHCAACHGVTANSTSPNPESPTFEEIANLRGLNKFTLGNFLRDSHNYPAAMNFTIERRQIRDLTAHILTLRHKDYHPDI